MASSEARLQARQARVQAVVAEMLAMELAEGGDDSHENINDIEDGRNRPPAQVLAARFAQDSACSHHML